MIRVLTALLLIPLVVVVNFHAPGWLVGTVFTLVALLCLREFFDMAARLRLQPFRVVGYGAAAVLILARDLPHPAFFRHPRGRVAGLVAPAWPLSRSLLGISLGHAARRDLYRWVARSGSRDPRPESALAVLRTPGELGGRLGRLLCGARNRSPAPCSPHQPKQDLGGDAGVGFAGQRGRCSLSELRAARRAGARSGAARVGGQRGRPTW